MKIYLQFYRLYVVWFSVANIVGIWLFLSLPVIPVILILKIFFYIGIYFLTASSIRKYLCYFQNLGYSSLAIFLRVAAINLAAFTLLISAIKIIITYAAD
ncbi:hypothetical protein [Pararcticibacter amylolyticus]|uniref:Uncharacterized protein n=1 Tax=Pararcticibacter amylolyticus TaxID=2173175 RepID=A0A2U2PHX3_9SPHI|nr:hypothetical protein [Pararcticibacter amylolyticus]PWG80739.1 hypothetical protein DDR33_09765 [Pararcticibacter amylolyticus]